MPISTFLPTVGGAEVGVHNIAKRLQQRGHEPVPIVPYQGYSKALALNLPYKIICVPPKVSGLVHRHPELGTSVLARIFGLYQWKMQFDYWHCTMGFPFGIPVVKLAERIGLENKYLIRCTGIDIQCAPEIPYGMRVEEKFDSIISRWYPRANRMVAISDTVEQEYLDLGVPRANIVRIPNGIDTKRLSQSTERNTLRQRFGIGKDDTLLLAVGRNHAKKGYSVLIEAVDRLAAKGFNQVHAVIVGKGCETLQPHIDELRLGHRIHLLKQISLELGDGVPEIPAQGLIDLYKAADIFAFPSLMETFGIVILEAMAAGLPVVTTDAPGCVDHIEHGHNGLISEAGNVEDFVAKLTTLIRSPNMGIALAKEALAKVSHYDWDRVTDLYLEQYLSGQNS